MTVWLPHGLFVGLTALRGVLNPSGPAQPTSKNLKPTNQKKSWAILTIVLVLLAALVALMYFSYRHDLSAARARVSSGSKLINTQCGLVEYADVGTGAPVLVIHGAGG